MGFLMDNNTPVIPPARKNIWGAGVVVLGGVSILITAVSGPCLLLIITVWVTE